MNMKKFIKSAGVTIAAFALTVCPMTDIGKTDSGNLSFPTGSIVAEAAENPYSKSYNIVNAVNYATKWWNGSNPEYKSINSWANPNCASFVSECLTAGGVYIPQAKKRIIGYSNTMWSVANDQYNYLKKQGYVSEKATDTTIHIGDVVYYDWSTSKDNKMDHAAYCIGVNSAGKPIIAEHTSNNIRAWNDTKTPRRNVYVVHMTNAVGHKDVTNEYRNQQISIKSLKNNSYVSSDTDNPKAVHTVATAKRSSVNEWEKFNVVDNKSITSKGGTSPAISLKTYTGKFLSAYISDSGAPMKNTGNVSTWEAFRIFRSGNTEYLLSLINGKFVQVRDNNKLYASGEGGWSWESYDISKVKNSSSSNVNTVSKKYTIKSSSGAKVRTNAGTRYGQKGGLAKGSVITYDQTKTANGYTWYHIVSVKTTSGSWGSFKGYWVANV